jgi:hypothetical protein
MPGCCRTPVKAQHRGIRRAGSGPCADQDRVLGRVKAVIPAWHRDDVWVVGPGHPRCGGYLARRAFKTRWNGVMRGLWTHVDLFRTAPFPILRGKRVIQRGS